MLHLLMLIRSRLSMRRTGGSATPTSPSDSPRRPLVNSTELGILWTPMAQPARCRSPVT